MTALDRETPHPGYWPSPWPVECGGNRRQKSRHGRLDAASGTAHVTCVRNGRWNVMAIEREPGQWYLGGTMPAFSGPPPFGWVQRIHPDTLEPEVTSPELPCGDHVWCGAILAHANGSIYSVNGSYLHRLDPDDLSVLAERRLPVDRSHNGLLALADGSLITKDLRLEGQGGTTLTRLAPEDLEPVSDPLVMPEGSMGRIAADLRPDGTEHIYVPGTEHLWRLGVDGDALVLDDWRPRYRSSGGHQGLAWDSCLSEGACWLLDCGDVEAVRAIHTAEPNGRWETPPNLSWRQPAPWTGPQRLIRINLEDPEDNRAVAPFGTAGGGIIAPPLHAPSQQKIVVWDSIHGGLAGLDDGTLEMAWQLDVRPTMQPVLFPESGEMAINDFTEDGSDDLIVVDVATGELVDRVTTGSRVANGMFLSAGGSRDILYCSTLSFARITWS
ncbi:MAG: hypothetical protein ACJZ7Z_05955 [Myxococcota bacterium]|nr:MAG: hypothetical protein CBC32_015325 [Proteobacteria bacterium TMED72]